MDWVCVSIALQPPIIAIFGVWIAYSQWRVNKANLKERLFERRWKVFKQTQNFLFEITGKIPIPGESIARFSDTHQKARYLFGKPMQDYLLEIYGHAGNINTARECKKDYFEKKQFEEVTEEDKSDYNKNVHMENESLKYLLNQQETIYKNFEPFLNFSKHK